MGFLNKIKIFKKGIYELSAFAITGVGCLLRILLASFHWPLLNSDEAIIGIMALHIAYRGEHPIFYYGQNYMGSLEAYLAAGLFQIFGSSVFILRLTVILLFSLFTIVMYFLTSTLYTKRLALFTLALLSLGSIPLLIREMSPIGGYPEILFFGACAFLLALWLALTSQEKMSPLRICWRLGGFTCWGVIAGLALWSDQLILPYLAGAFLLLIVWCWREPLLKWGGICLLFGLTIGASPLILYNLNALPGQDSLSILLAQIHPATTSPDSLAALSMHISNTLLYDLPTATGDPLCPLVFSQGPVTMPGLPCAVGHIGWSLGLIALWIVAVIWTLPGCAKVKRAFQQQPCSREQRLGVICQFARLMLLGSAGVTALIFISSASAIPASAGNSRYLHCLLISIPALIWPLWSPASAVKLSSSLWTTRKTVLSRGVLVLIGIAFLAGTGAAFLDSRNSSTIDQQRQVVLHRLESMGIKHFYTQDYWTCYRMAFASGEKLTCAVIESNLVLGTHYRNRYWPYVLQVQADRRAAYVLPLRDRRTPQIVQNAHLATRKYVHVQLDGYAIYQPT